MKLDADCEAEVDVVELTRDQELEQAAIECRRTLNLDLDEFRRRWESGEYRNVSDPAVTRVAMMLPDAW